MIQTRLLLLLILISSFGACKTLLVKKKVKYFEGVITYSVETKIKKNSVYSDYISKKYGSRMDSYWNSDGDLLRFTSGNEVGLDYTLFKNDLNTCYTKFKQLDTLYYYPASETFDKIIEIKTGPKKTILNQECRSWTFVVESLKKDTFQMHYFYSGYPHINKFLYQDLKDGYANLIYKMTESPFMFMELDFDTHSISYEAIQIEEKKIKKERFEIDKNLVLKRD